MVSEQIHRYPRWITWLIELFTAIGVTIAMLRFARDLLRYLWDTRGLDATLFPVVPYLPELVLSIGGVKGVADREHMGSVVQLLPALGWLALALLLSILLRNLLPTIRTSPRGMLVEFAGG